MVNVMWFGSVVLCLGCSVFATLIQQQARRYLILTQRPGAPYERARLRTFLFNGLRKFQVNPIRQLLAMSMHVSILLYCVGLVIYIFTISRNIGSLTLGPLTLGPNALGYLAIVYLAVFYLIYAFLTFLPFRFFDCPYGTPFTALAWCLSHIFLFGIFSTIRRILFHGPIKWRDMLKKRVNKHKQRFWDGLQRTVELFATEAPQPVDANVLEWTLLALVENKEIENFATWVPEFFGTYTRSGAPESEAIPPLMSNQPPTNPIFGFHIHHPRILRTLPLEEEERKRRLQICLKCLWRWAREYNQKSVPLPSYFPLLSPDMIRDLQAKQDPTSSMIGLCFSALVAKKLAADVNSPHFSDVRIHDAKLASLTAIVGRTEVETFLSQPGLASINFLTSRETNTFGTEKVPLVADVQDIFQTTVETLAEDIPTSGLPRNLVDRFNTTYSNAQQLPALAWLTDKLEPIKDKLQGPGRPGADDHFSQCRCLNLLG